MKISGNFAVFTFQSKGIESIEMLIEKDKITQLSMSQDGSKSILHGSNVYDRVAGPSKHVQEMYVLLVVALFQHLAIEFDQNRTEDDDIDRMKRNEMMK